MQGFEVIKNKQRVKSKLKDALHGEHPSVALLALESISREIRLQNGIRINNEAKQVKR